MAVFHSELLLFHKVTQNFDNAAVLVRIFERYKLRGEEIFLAKPTPAIALRN